MLAIDTSLYLRLLVPILSIICGLSLERPAEF